jgi:hypothetical protein
MACDVIALRLAALQALVKQNQRRGAPLVSHEATQQGQPAEPGPQTFGLLQPWAGSRMRAGTGPARPRKVSTAPSQSTRACAAPRWRPGTATAIRSRVMITNGTLVANISRQEAASTR